MANKKCISCGREGKYLHNNGGWVCEKCLGAYFTCPDCQLLFDQDDRVNGDVNGFCAKCAPNH